LNYCVGSGLYMILFIVNQGLEVLGSVPTSKIVTNQRPPLARKRSPHREKANGMRANAMVINPSKLLA
jgi:hypothetical protein